MATVDDKKIIFSMVGVSKIIPQNQKQILKNIYLSFFYGAKIGIIGLNGAGKSTLMKIIAGLEQPTQGEVVWSPGYSVGYLPQDPPLDENKTVKENVMEGVQKIYDALAEYEEINNKFGLEEYYGDPDKMDKLMQRQAEVQDIIDATDAWNIDSKLERAMAAVTHKPAAVVKPLTTFFWKMMVPAPRNPIPETTWAATREESFRSKPNPYWETTQKSALPRATRK